LTATVTVQVVDWAPEQGVGALLQHRELAHLFLVPVLPHPWNRAWMVSTSSVAWWLMSKGVRGLGRQFWPSPGDGQAESR
jgi:hypothetical protein